MVCRPATIHPDVKLMCTDLECPPFQLDFCAAWHRLDKDEEAVSHQEHHYKWWEQCGGGWHGQHQHERAAGVNGDVRRALGVDVWGCVSPLLEGRKGSTAGEYNLTASIALPYRGKSWFWIQQVIILCNPNLICLRRLTCLWRGSTTDQLSVFLD